MRRLWAAGRAYHRAHLASVRLPGGAWSGSLPTCPSRPPTWSCRGRPYRPDPTLDTARRRRAAPADPRDLHRLRGGRPHLPGGLVPRAGAGVRQHDPGDRHHRHRVPGLPRPRRPDRRAARSEEHTSELQSRPHLVCRLLLEKKKKDLRPFLLKKKKEKKKNKKNQKKK